MRLRPISVTLLVLLFSAGLLGIGWLVLRPKGELLTSAQFSHNNISPNADGVDDLTRITYQLERPANVSIYFLASDNTRYNFRTDNPREAGEYNLLFSGVVDGFTLPNESIEGEVLNRVLPDGEYTWVVSAANTTESAQLSGHLSIVSADTLLPEIRGFSISPEIFTPNRDGIDDRTWINLYLTKDAHLTVHLVEFDNAIPRPIGEKETNVEPGKKGLHVFEYEGDVDFGVEPPSDGTHQIVALAQDALGQKVRQVGNLQVQNGGVPRAEIVNATVEYNSSTILQGEPLCFELTVENYGRAPIRTTAPEPGFNYVDSETSNTHQFYEESGAWRVGIDCDTCIRDYPWRWAVGEQADLTKIGDYYYLMPGERSVVRGCIDLTEIPSRNPLYFWAGLIHEDVEVSSVNNRVDPFYVKIVPKNE
ncbi:MAG TPA: hypothetical protein PK299_06075 [Anaerolineales bacterium]|nr:hypothetical protein [Anaerolineales bacterium]